MSTKGILSELARSLTVKRMNRLRLTYSDDITKKKYRNTTAPAKIKEARCGFLIKFMSAVN